jgi:hypothetical protein
MSTLPVPVARFVDLAMVEHPDPIDTMVIETTAWMRRPMLPPIPLAIRMSHQLGFAFVHEIRVGRGRLSVRFGLDVYVDGRGLMKVGPSIQTGPTFDQGALIAMWGEAMTFPSSWLARDDVRWEPIDDDAASLVVPARDGDVSLKVTFDAATGWPASCEADRYKTPEAMVYWFGYWRDWRANDGGPFAPHRLLVRWADEDRPWLDVQVASIHANAPIEGALEVARNALAAGAGRSSRRADATGSGRPPRM